MRAPVRHIRVPGAREGELATSKPDKHPLTETGRLVGVDEQPIVQREDCCPSMTSSPERLGRSVVRPCVRMSELGVPVCDSRSHRRSATDVEVATGIGVREAIAGGERSEPRRASAAMQIRPDTPHRFGRVGVGGCSPRMRARREGRYIRPAVTWSRSVST